MRREKRENKPNNKREREREDIRERSRKRKTPTKRDSIYHGTQFEACFVFAFIVSFVVRVWGLQPACALFMTCPFHCPKKGFVLVFTNPTVQFQLSTLCRQSYECSVGAGRLASGSRGEKEMSSTGDGGKRSKYTWKNKKLTLRINYCKSNYSRCKARARYMVGTNRRRGGLEF